MEIIKESQYPLKYVGDGDLWVDGLNPDFVCSELNKIVEVFGDYWHGPAVRNPSGTEAVRRKLFAGKGYELLVVWEHELSNKELVCQKLNSFLNIYRNHDNLGTPQPSSVVLE